MDTGTTECRGSAAAVELFLDASAEVHRYVSRLTGGDRELTEDVVQDVFVTLLRRDRAGMPAPLTTGWLITTARHRLIDHVRSRSRDLARATRAGAALTTSPGETAATIEDGLVASDGARWMLAQLPLVERVALGLHVIDGLPVSAVAELLDRSEEATASLLARARRRLRSAVVQASQEAATT